MMNIFKKFKDGLKKTTSNFSKGIKEIIINKEIGDKELEKIEEFLIQSDVGLKASSEIREVISNRKIDPSKNELLEIQNIIKNYLNSLMKPLEKKYLIVILNLELLRLKNLNKKKILIKQNLLLIGNEIIR